MFFDSWTEVGRTLVTGVLIYLIVVAVLRLTGKRTLSKWNAFDFVITIALGSTMATAILSKEVTVVEGGQALTLLVILQFGVTWLAVRSSWVRRLIKGEPVLLLYQGQLREQAMRRERVTESEVRAAIRAHGIARIEEVAAVVLETDGTFSVVKELDGEATSLHGVKAGEYPFMSPPMPRSATTASRSCLTRQTAASREENASSLLALHGHFGRLPVLGEGKHDLIGSLPAHRYGIGTIYSEADVVITFLYDRHLRLLRRAVRRGTRVAPGAEVDDGAERVAAIVAGQFALQDRHLLELTLHPQLPHLLRLDVAYFEALRLDVLALGEAVSFSLRLRLIGLGVLSGIATGGEHEDEAQADQPYCMLP